MPFIHIFENYRKTLLLDYDITKEQFEKVRPLLEARYRDVLGSNYCGYGATLSTHGHVHITIYLCREVNDATAIILQALLGSDFKRECLNWWRLVETGDSRTLFANDKKSVKKESDCREDRGFQRTLREFALEKCPGLVIWMSHFAIVKLYTGKWIIE